MNERINLRRPVMAAVLFGATLASLAPQAAAYESSSEPSASVLANLGRYCSACWRNARLPINQWADCTQSVFQRLLERVPSSAWDRFLAEDTEERREFLRAIDAEKKRIRRARSWGNQVDDLADHRDRHERRIKEDREAVQRASQVLLSDRQKNIMQRSFEGWSIHEIATDLKLPAARVSDEKYKAIHKLRSVLTEKS